MDFLFSIFEFLIVAGGPFFVFAGMGKDKNVGKLTFRKIIAADDSIEITENSGFGGECVTLKSNISNVLVPANKVPWGTGSSITWGFLEVDTNVHALTGVYIIANDPISIIGTTFSTGNNLIINPYNNKLEATRDTTIITSKKSTICQGGRRNSLIGGFCNRICSGDNFSIINSCTSCSNYAYSSSILSSFKSNMCETYFSTIISSRKGNINNTPTGQKVCYSTIISSYLGTNTGNDNSTVISSRNFYLIHSNPLSSAHSNSIISSCSSCITGGQIVDGITSGSIRSTILASCNSIINDSHSSAIISGRNNFICVYTYGGGNVNTSYNCSNTIIGGYCNKIHQYDTPETYGSVKYNSILSSRCSCIYSSSEFNSILTSDKCTYITNGYLNAIIGGGVCNNKTIISSSNKSSIVNSQCSSISTNSSAVAIVGGFCQCISEGTSSGIIGGSSHIIRNKSSMSSILGGCFNRLCSANGSAIVAGHSNQITSSDYSSILGGFSNLIYKVNNSAVLGGIFNCIESPSAKGITDDVIIAGCKNKIYSSGGVIVGGKNNYIGNGGSLLYSAILGGEGNTMDKNHSVIVGSLNKSSSGGSSYQTHLTNLIFDKHICINSLFYGRTSTINLPASFKIRMGFITT